MSDALLLAVRFAVAGAVALRPLLAPVPTPFLLGGAILACLRHLQLERIEGRWAPHQTDEALTGLLCGPPSVMLALAAGYTVGLWALGLELALPIDRAAGLASFVPDPGFVVGIALASPAAGVLEVWVRPLHDNARSLSAVAVVEQRRAPRCGAP